jgi:cytochrome P450
MNVWTILSLIILGVVHLAGLTALVYSALRAPEGYEDADGFHLGRQPAPEKSAVETSRLEHGDLKHAA